MLQTKDIQHWFEAKSWKVHSFQEEVWSHFENGKHGLLNAPTGSGKTLALWMPICKQISQQQSKKPGLKALWITPLKALAQEIELSTQEVVDDLKLDISIGIRTGDTPNAVRAKQRKKMPDLLITTPESLHLLMSAKLMQQQFNNCCAIVIDEWHELMGSKRGVQIELALSRLKNCCSQLRIWGISATIGNIDQAKEVLLGPEGAYIEEAVLVKSSIDKKIEVQSIFPEKMDRFPWRGHMGLQQIDNVIEIIQNNESTLIFTNTRSQCEIWFQKLLQRVPEFAGELAMHHGSIEKKTRLWVEQAIRNGNLKAVVCTSSLDLGVDFSPVEAVVQIGGPKGVARFLQRAGRSGHRPGAVSKINFVPTHAIELVEASALKKATQEQHIEERIPYLNSFDVLIQYLLTLAIGPGFYPDEIYKEVKSTFCFQAISDEQWNWVLNFITVGSQSLSSYDEYKKAIRLEDGKIVVENRGIAMRHRLQIGTIVSDAMVNVHYQNGQFLGTVEEWFISQLKEGDVFIFAGRTLELIRLRHMKAKVRNSKRKTSRVPAWMGGRLSLTAHLSELLRQELYSLHAASDTQTIEIQALKPIVSQQLKESIIPKTDEFLVECFETKEGFHHVFYPFEGRFVHEAFASLLSYRVGLLQPISCSIAYNDYGFELLSDQKIDLEEVFEQNLLSSVDLVSDLRQSLNINEMAKRCFRDIAVISGLVLSSHPAATKTKHLQSSSQLLYKVFKDFEPDNLLYQQAHAETFEHHLEEGRLRLALNRISKQHPCIVYCEHPTPLSFPIITDRLRASMSTESLEDRIAKMIENIS